MRTRELMVAAIALTASASLLAQQPSPPAPRASSSPISMTVAISVDAPPDMHWTITDRLTRRLKNIPNLTYVERQPDWVIAVVAFDPFPKEKNAKRRQYSMSSAFLQQMTWTDPSLLDLARENPCVPAEKVTEYGRTQRMLGNLFTMGAYAGRFDELGSTTDGIVSEFVEHVLEPAIRNSAQQTKAPAAKGPVKP